MEKYYYVEELCPVSHYRGLFPAAYEKTEEGYRKRGMSCQLAAEGRCGQSAECPVSLAAPGLLPKDLEWKLCEKLLGRE